jgi:hypothetical protein
VSVANKLDGEVLRDEIAGLQYNHNIELKFYSAYKWGVEGATEGET